MWKNYCIFYFLYRLSIQAYCNYELNWNHFRFWNGNSTNHVGQQTGQDFQCNFIQLMGLLAYNLNKYTNYSCATAWKEISNQTFSQRMPFKTRSMHSSCILGFFNSTLFMVSTFVLTSQTWDLIIEKINVQITPLRSRCRLRTRSLLLSC